jgi:hypothetical protein
MEWDFDLLVSELSEQDAQDLLDLITNYVSISGGLVAGGFVKHEADDEKPE